MPKGNHGLKGTEQPFRPPLDFRRTVQPSVLAVPDRCSSRADSCLCQTCRVSAAAVPNPNSRKLPMTARIPDGIVRTPSAAALPGPDRMTSVAATGTPYPIAIVAPNNGKNGSIAFDEWNKTVSISAPKGAVDIGSLGG